MPRLIATALLGALLLATGGCKSDSERLIDLRAELRADMDELYARYGGGELATRDGEDAADEGSGADGRDVTARLFGQIDRSYFESYCLAHGRGERPFNLSGKLEAFMKDPSNQEACREAAKLDARIRELEAKVAAPR